MHAADLLGPLLAAPATLPALVPTALEGPAPGPYLAIWPRGVPHEARSVGDVPRVSLTVPLQPVGAKTNVDHGHRVEGRLRAHLDGDLAYLAADTDPYAEGATHKHPEREAELMHYFAHLIPTEEQVESYLQTMGLLDALANP